MSVSLDSAKQKISQSSSVVPSMSIDTLYGTLIALYVLFKAIQSKSQSKANVNSISVHRLVPWRRVP